MSSLTLLLTGLMSALIADPVKLPFGFPPQPETSAVDQAAPEECMFLFSWAGTATIDPTKDREAMSDIEKFLSEEEVRASLQSVVSAIESATRNEEQELRIIAKWVQKLLAHPGMVFVEDFTVKGEDVVKAGGIVDLQEDADEIEPAMKRLFRNAPADAVAEVEVDGKPFYKIDIDGKFDVYLGVVEQYLIAATSEEIATRLMSAKAATRPMWLTELQAKSKVKQRSMQLYVNIAKVMQRVADPDEIPPEVETMLAPSSLDSLSIVSGFDDAGYLSHGQLKTKQGKSLGRIFDVFSEQTITAETFKDVPADATLALALRLDPQRLLDSIREGMKETSPDDLADFEESLADYQAETGMSLEKDILPAFGDEIVIYHSKNEGGLLSGFTAMLEVKNPETAWKLQSILLEQASSGLDEGWGYGPRYFKSEWQGETIHTMVNTNDFSPFLMPSMCVTKDRVIVSLLPQNIQTILSRGEGFKSLAESEAIKTQLTEHGNIVLYNNAPEFVKAIYPALQFGMFFLSQEMHLSPLDPGVIPSGEVLMRHLKQDVSSIGRRDENIEFVTRSSLPGLDHLMLVGAGIFIAEEGIHDRQIQQLIGAFSPGYGKEQRSNLYLRQIGLGLHNYHDTFKTFPAAAMPSREDRDKEDAAPLLSWRVHILPFMEQVELYEQFNLDEPWDSEHNIKLVDKMPAIYLAPGSKAGANKTNYVTIRSEESVFPGTRAIHLSDIKDGTSNTIAVVEANDANAVIWSKPDDLVLDAMHPLEEIIGLRRKAFLALLCDGSVQKFDESIGADNLNAIITRDGGEAVDPWEWRE